MQVFDLFQLIAQSRGTDRRYREFLRAPSLSIGLYRLPAGALDTQNPHTEDEVYYIVSGRGSFQVADEHQAVQPGTLLFVPAGLEHRFHTITEDVTILVFFAPPENSRASANLPGPGQRR